MGSMGLHPYLPLKLPVTLANYTTATWSSSLEHIKFSYTLGPFCPCVSAFKALAQYLLMASLFLSFWSQLKGYHPDHSDYVVFPTPITITLYGSIFCFNALISI